MATHHQHELRPEALGEQGERCHCGAELARDQRYCLNCGERRGSEALPFMQVIEGRLRRSLAAEAPTDTRIAAAPRRSPLLPVAGIAAFALVLGLGVLIGALASGGDSKQVAQAPPQVITVAAPSAATLPARAQFSGDWPDGKNGYTVELQALRKNGTDPSAVAAAKSAAAAKGAADVGALDSDSYSSLRGGDYVLYSGVFDTRKQAAKALRRLRRHFPGAKVVKVSAGGAGASSGKRKEATVGRGQLQKLRKLSPDQYQKKSRKLPDTTKLPGKAPPKDNKKPGGNSGGGQVIG